MNTMTETQLNHPARLWLVNEYLTQPGMSKAAAAAQLGISHKVLNALISGSYAGNTDAQLAKLDEQRERLSATFRRTDIDLDHVPTELMRRIFHAADAAKIARLIVGLAGRSHIGKSTAARAYKKLYPETTILFEMPSPATTGNMLREMMRACGLPPEKTSYGRYCALREYLSERNLVIVDEAHCALYTEAGLAAIDTLRKLFNESRCAMLFIYTDKAARDVEKGKNAGRLEQLRRRGEWELLPDVPSSGDIRAIWEAYGLPEPDGETLAAIGAMVRGTCFGQFTARLRYSAGIAQREGRAISWADFMDYARRVGRRPE